MQNDWRTHARLPRGTEGLLWILASDPSPSTLFRWKYPAYRQGSNPPALVFFSDRRTVQESSLAKIPMVDVKLELDNPPTREEIKKTTMQLKVGKSPGIDGIQAEDGIRDELMSRGLGDVYKRQPSVRPEPTLAFWRVFLCYRRNEPI